MSRREYAIRIIVNGILITKAVIDSHYEKKHSESVNDEIIKELVGALNGKFFVPDAQTNQFSYFVTESRDSRDKRFKLIWLLEEHETYIGVVNAYRI